MIQVLLREAGVELHAGRGRGGLTALMLAAGAGHPNLVIDGYEGETNPCTMVLIATDGVYLDEPRTVENVIFVPGLCKLVHSVHGCAVVCVRGGCAGACVFVVVFTLASGGLEGAGEGWIIGHPHTPG